MAKYQKPLRSTYSELFDVDWDWQKKEQVKETYAKFWMSLEEEDREELDSMLQ